LEFLQKLFDGIESQRISLVWRDKILPKGSNYVLDQLHDANADRIGGQALGQWRGKKYPKNCVGQAGMEEKIGSLLQEEDFLVQPFIPEIVQVGEYSLIFFNEKLSHAVLKTPASADFRVQHYYGGTIQRSYLAKPYLRLRRPWSTASLKIHSMPVWME
jgi:hypothetical protein